MGARLVSIFPVLFVLLAFTIFVDAFPSFIESNKSDHNADAQDWSNLTECSEFLAAVKRSSNSYRKCILDRIRDANGDEVFSNLSSAVDSCASTDLWRSLDIRRIPGPTEHNDIIPENGIQSGKDKFVIPPPAPTVESPSECVAVFMGIDEVIYPKKPDLNTSLELLKLAPGCRLHLVRPKDDRNFTTIGRFHPVRIFKAATNDPERCFDMFFTHEGWPLTCSSIKDFLESLDGNKTEPSVVDYLWHENPYYNDFYDVFQAYSFLTDELRNVSVCQVMIYGPRGLGHEYSNTPEGGFKGVVTNVLEKSGFIPLRSELDASAIYRFPCFREFYFNVANPYCVAKFIAPQFGVNSCGKRATIQRKEKVINGQFELETELI